MKFFMNFCGILQLNKGTHLVKFGIPAVCDVKNAVKDWTQVNIPRWVVEFNLEIFLNENVQISAEEITKTAYLDRVVNMKF